MITRLLYLLTALVEAVLQALKRKEQREAQHDRDEIEADSAQHASDKFGDGRVHPIPERKADEAKRPDGNGG